MSEGVITPRKKNLLRLLCLALLARCATGTLLASVCSHRKRERRIHRLLLRQIQMNLDDKENPQIPEIKYNMNLEQKEGKVWQALVLMDPVRTHDGKTKGVRQSSQRRRLLWSRSRNETKQDAKRKVRCGRCVRMLRAWRARRSDLLLIGVGDGQQPTYERAYRINTRRNCPFLCLPRRAVQRVVSWTSHHVESWDPEVETRK